MTPDSNLSPLPVPPLTDDAALEAPKAAAQAAPPVGPRPSARPDGGDLDDYPTSDLSPLPPELELDGRTADALAFATDQLESGRAELSGVVAELINEAAAELNANGALSSGVTDEVIGAAELDLARADEPLNRLLFNVVKAAHGELEALMDGARNVGLEIPWAAAHQAIQAELPVFDQVAQVVPGLARFLLPTAPPAPPAAAGPTDSPSVDVPELAPPVAPPPAPPTVPASGYQPTIVYAPLPAVAPPIAAAPVPVSGYSPPPPAAAEAGCPTPHVTVNVAPAPVFLLPGAQTDCEAPVRAEVAENGAGAAEPPLPSPLIEAERKLQEEKNKSPFTPKPGSIPAKEYGLVPQKVDPLAKPSKTRTIQGQPVQDDWGTVEEARERQFAPEFDGPILPKWEDAKGIRCWPKVGPPPLWMLKAAAKLNFPQHIGEDLGRTGEHGFQWNDPESVAAWEASMMRPRGRTGRALAALDELLGTGRNPSVPRPLRGLKLATILAAVNKAEKLTDAPLSYMFQSEVYEYQSANPQYLPQQVRTDDAYLSDLIDEATWNAWTRANGNLPEPARRTMLANARRLSVEEAITLYRRGGIDRTELAARMRAQGVLDPCLGDEFLRISEQLPTQSDLVRFMVRDAADQTVVEKYELDEDFDKKYTGPLKDWGKALGIPDDYFRYVWRSHWEIPSYTQLREMFHRLRPNRSALKNWDDNARVYGEAATKQHLGPRPASVTRAEVREALKTDDVAPGWVDKLLDISYTPINRTDALRAYQIGAFDEARLLEAFLDLGYSPTDAQTMLNFYRIEKRRRQRGQMKVMSAGKVIGYYKAGAMRRDVADQYLRQLLGTAEDAKSALDTADDESRGDFMKQRLALLKRKYFTGENSLKDTIAALEFNSVDPPKIQQLTALWEVERGGKFRHLSAAKAMEMVREGLMSVEEGRTRLLNLNYREADADYLLARALKIEGEGDGMKADELDRAIREAVRTRKQANKQSNTLLMRRLKAITAEVVRIQNTLRDRGVNPDAPKEDEP